MKSDRNVMQRVPARKRALLLGFSGKETSLEDGERKENFEKIIKINRINRERLANSPIVKELVTQKNF